MPKHSALLSLGSNMPEAEENVKRAIAKIGGLFDVLSSSGVYTSEPAGGVGAKYANAVVKITTDRTPEALTALFKKWEIEAGRDAEARSLGIVPLDIDVVASDDKILRPTDYARPYFIKGLEMMK